MREVRSKRGSIPPKVGDMTFMTAERNYILLEKSFATLHLISLYFKLQIPVESRKMIRSSSIFQRLFSVPITLVSVKDQKFWEMKLFLFKTTFLTWQEVSTLCPLRKLMFFRLILQQRWSFWPLICWDIFYFSSTTAERNWKKTDRKQVLNVLYQGWVFGAIKKGGTWYSGVWFWVLWTASL